MRIATRLTEVLRSTGGSDDARTGGGALGRTGSESGQDPLVDLLGERLIERVGERRPHLVVICAPVRRDDLLERIAALHPDARVDVHTTADLSALHVAMAAAGKADAVIEATRGEQRAEIFMVAFMHLHAQGEMVLLDAVDNGDGADPEGARAIGELLARLVLRGVTPQPRGRRTARAAVGIGRSLESVRVVAPHVAVALGRSAKAILREEEVAGWAQAVSGVRAAEVYSRLGGSVDVSPPAESRPCHDPDWYDRPHHAPRLRLREYEGVSCSVGQVVAWGNVILPETFRQSHGPQRLNHFLDQVSGRFARVPALDRPIRDLPGTYFHLDSEVRGHFGHAMSEQVSRLWAWPEVKRRHPEAKVLMLSQPKRPELQQFEYDLFGAAGIEAEDLVLADGPVRVERLFGATPMLSHPEWLHPGIVQVWDRIGDALAAQAPRRERPRRLFVSRRVDKRECVNRAEVERYFSEAGFTVYFPEDDSLAEQVAIFRAADTVVGLAGSALMTLQFVPRPTRVLVLTPETYSAKNDHLIAALRGHELSVAWCPDVETPVPGRPRFQSDYRVDFAREGAFLRDFLSGHGKTPA